MRVDYTLPSLQPGTLDTTAGLSTDAKPSFRSRLASKATVQSATWDQQLRLDARPFTGSYIGPPPRPNNIELKDAETERFHWRNMLSRHGQAPAASAGSTHAMGNQAVQGMLQMLLDMQHAEDAIVARNAAVTRG
jgi:hypothetical protein